MSEFSNALRVRFASGEKPQVHPDADILTAYLEQLLPAPERKQVVEHLAVCSECRDVMVLSLPDQSDLAEGRAAMTIAPVRRGWRAWILGRPALGLAASVAGLAIVATLIVERPRGSFQKPSQPASAASAGNNAPALVSEQPTAAATEPATSPAADKSLPEPHFGLAGRAPNATDAETATATTTTRLVARAPESGVGGPYVNTQMFANNDIGNAAPSQNELPSPPSPRPLANQNLSGNDTQLSAADAPHQAQSSKPLRMFTPPTSTSHFGLSMVTTLGTTMGRDAKQLFRRPTPLSTGFVYNSAMGGAGQFNPAGEIGSSPEIATAAPLAGKDAAELYQSHAFTARALAGANKKEGAAGEDRLAARTEPGPAWRVGERKLLKQGDSGAWVEGYSAAEGIEFSVVASRGTDIWAGGGNAAVVHSRDGGATWERITLGAAATGTVTSIEADGLKVLVKSSSGQSWASPDGGKTWVLQD